MSNKKSVIIVGGGIMGVSAAYFLAEKGCHVTLLDQFDVPNRWAASGDQLRVFRLTYGKDAFYTEMAAKTLPLWLEFNRLAEDKLLLQNGMLELAAVTHGYEEQSLKVLKDMKLSFSIVDKKELQRRYPMINSRAVKYGLFHKDGGMIWSSKAVAAVSVLAQRKGAKIRGGVKVTAVLKDKSGICGLKDSAGKRWEAENYVFMGGAWTPELLKGYGVPLKVTLQEQLYLRPPINRGRYRPEHFPVFAALSEGFYGLPMHIHGFMKIGYHRSGPAGKPGPGQDDRLLTRAFEKKCRTFLKRYIPELASFTEMEGHTCHYDNTKDGDFIIDRLPDAPNALIAAGFSGHGFKFGPLVGKTVSELVVGGKSELNLHRFRLGRFKLKKG
jgi:monomeric sarcosine oxidase